MNGRRSLGALCALVLIAASGPAQAHDAGVSTSRIAIERREVRATVNALARDYEKAVGVKLAEGIAGDVNPVALALNAKAILAYLEARVTALAGGQACPIVRARPSAVDSHVVATLAWRCPDDGSPLSYRVTLFQEIDPAARHVALIQASEDEQETVLDKSSPETDLSGAAMPFFEVAGRFLLAGVDHIFLGYDHVAFLIAVIAWGRRFWPLFKVVTAFTIAHSITLSLAAFGVVSPPAWLVEPLIAASIVFVAAENFVVRDIIRRWRITFLFGLVHGLGFASALREIGLPRDALLPALTFFNLGVEVGQAAIVTLVLPPLLLFDRLTQARPALRVRVIHAASAAILALGLYWLAERTVLAAVP